MEGKLKYVTPIFGLLFGVPVSVIYGQNIESWATSHGFDSVLTNGVQAVGNNPWGLPLLLAFLVCMGATIGLWAEFGVRRRWPSKPAKITRRVENKNFRHERVVVDGNYFVDCHFEGTTLVLLGTAAYGFNRCNFGDISVDFPDQKLSLSLGLFELVRQSGRPIRIGAGVVTDANAPDPQIK